MTETADLELRARLRRGDERALARLLDQYWSPLLAYATRLLRSRDAAEDAVQEAFVRLWQHRESWDLEGSVRGLLYRVTRNAALDERKRRVTRRRLAGQVNRPGATPPADLEVVATELEVMVARAIARLPPRRREIFLLARRDGLSYHQIAFVLDLSVQTVANHMSLALRDLRHAVAPHLDRPSRDDASGTR
jgi:RNA polymerase sigma-70 factor (ECF subfamily)